MNLENVVSLKFEVDTGASHNIISKRCFDQLQNSLIRQGKEKSKSLPHTVKIRLTNGTMDPNECKVVQIHVSSDLKKFETVYPLTFLVLEGPNNLIGRHSLQRLWPKEFNAFKNKCEPKVVNTVSGTNKVSVGDKNPIETPENNSTNEVKATSGSLTNEKPVENKSKSIIKFVPNSRYADIDSLVSDGTAQKKQKIKKKNLEVKTPKFMI